MEKESIITKKIRFYPNKKQIKLFKLCFNGDRFMFNMSNEI